MEELSRSDELIGGPSAIVGGNEVCGRSSSQQSARNVSWLPLDRLKSGEGG